MGIVLDQMSVLKHQYSVFLIVSKLSDMLDNLILSLFHSNGKAKWLYIIQK